MAWEHESTDGRGSRIYSFSARPNHDLPLFSYRNEADSVSESSRQTALTTAASPRFDSIGAILRDVRRDNMGPIGHVSITPQPRTWRAPLTNRSKAPRRLSYSSDSRSTEASSDVIQRRRPASPLRPMQTEPAAAAFSISVAGANVPVRDDSWRQTMKKPIYVQSSDSAVKTISPRAIARAESDISSSAGIDEHRYIGGNRLPPVRNISEQSTVTVNFSGLQKEGDLDFDCGEKLIRDKSQRQRQRQRQHPELSVSSATSDDHLGDESWLQSSDSSMIFSSPSASRSPSGRFASESYSRSESGTYSDSGSERFSESPSAFSTSATALSESDHMTSPNSATAAATDSFVSTSAAMSPISELSSDVSVTNTNTNTLPSRNTEPSVIGLGQTSDEWRQHGLYGGRQRKGARDEELESSDFDDDDDDDLSQQHHQERDSDATDSSSLFVSESRAPVQTPELPAVAELWSTNDDAEDFHEASLKASPFDLESGAPTIGREHSIELKALVWSMQKLKSCSNVFAIGSTAFLLVLIVVSIVLPELPVFAAASVWLILSGMTYRELYDVSAALSGLLQMCSSLSGQGPAMPLDNDDVDLEKLVREGVQNNLVRFKLVLVTDAGASGAFGLLLCITWLMSTASLSIVSLLIGIVVMLMAIAGAFVALHLYSSMGAELRTRLDRSAMV